MMFFRFSPQSEKDKQIKEVHEAKNENDATDFQAEPFNHGSDIVNVVRCRQRKSSVSKIDEIKSNQ